MRILFIRSIHTWLVLTLAILLISCGGGSDDNSNGSTLTNKARFTFNCDLNGLNAVFAVLAIDIEAVGTSGIVWGGGPDPQITGVIGTGDVNYFTAGTLNSATASYVFTGTNDFADFTNLTFPETFRVKWVIAGNGGLTMVINPFGIPTTHSCEETSSAYI